MIKISVVINTLNEEANIADCIRSVQELADEVVVCDMHSDDRTVSIASELGAKIVYHERTGFVEPARFYAISQARGEWVLVLDADERLTEPLAGRLCEVASRREADVVVFSSLFFYFGKWIRHGGFFSCSWPRFFRKMTYLETYCEGEEMIHMNFSTLLASPSQLKLPAEYYILHYAYPTIEKYVTKTIGVYARVEAEERLKRGGRFQLSKMVCSPIKQFVVRYIVKQGFLDGLAGLVLAVLYSVFHFAIWANLWYLQKTRIQN